uniref:Uncharacterized protein n=1 Tax=Anopheles culicifacies TaxID=139723 RepID=A0A182LZI0_9DIPT
MGKSAPLPDPAPTRSRHVSDPHAPTAPERTPIQPETPARKLKATLWSMFFICAKKYYTDTYRMVHGWSGSAAEEIEAPVFERTEPKFESHSGCTPVRRTGYPVAGTFKSRKQEMAGQDLSTL